LKRYLVTLLKIVASASIIVFLVWRATRPQEDGGNVFKDLRDQPKDWLLLGAACLVCATAVVLTFIRWWYLVRTLELPFRFTEALRLGFLGYLLNLAPMGIVGGDLLKAVALAQQHPQARARAVASVGVDRAIGFFVLFVVASCAILLTGCYWSPVPEVRWPCLVILGLTVLGALALFGLMRPGMSNGRFTRALGRLPRIGPALESLIEAVRMYRRKPVVLLAATWMSVGVHSLFVLGVFLIALGLPGDDLSLGAHFVAVPISSTTGALPLPFGPFEFLLDLFYTHMPGTTAAIPAGQGLVVALAYRLITILIAAVGICYYLSSRREVAQVLQQAEQHPNALHVGETDRAA